MTAIITKRRKAYNVIYTVENEDGVIEKKYETFYSHDQAMKRKKQIENGKSDKLVINKNTPFVDFLNQYASIIIFNEYSISKYEYMQSLLNNYLSKVIEDEKIKEINSKSAKRIISDLQTLPGPPIKNQQANDVICASALKGCLQLLSQSSDYLVESNLLNLNYFKKYRPKVSVPKNEPLEWNLSYWNSLITNCTNEKLFILLHLCFDSGLSLSEVRAITWDNLEYLKEGYIISDKILKRLNKNIVLELNPTKILKTYRKKGFNNTNTIVVLLKKDNAIKVKLHSQVIELLMSWREKNRKSIDSESTIYSSDDGLPYDDRVVNKQFKKLKEKAELPDLSLVKLIKFGNTENEQGVFYKIVYYSTMEHPLKCKEPDLEEVRRKMNSRHGTQFKNEWKKSFNDRTADLLPKEDHSDLDSLIDKLKTDPRLKNELLHKLLGKE